MEPTQQSHPITQEQLEGIIFHDYFQKVEDGVISLRFDEKTGTTYLVHKQFDTLTGKEKDPIELPYTSNSIDIVQVNRSQHLGEIDKAILNLQEQRRKYQFDTDAVLSALKADILALEAKFQPSIPQLDPRNQAKRDAEAQPE